MSNLIDSIARATAPGCLMSQNWLQKWAVKRLTAKKSVLNPVMASLVLVYGLLEAMAKEFHLLSQFCADGISTDKNVASVQKCMHI